MGEEIWDVLGKAALEVDFDDMRNVSQKKTIVIVRNRIDQDM